MSRCGGGRLGPLCAAILLSGGGMGWMRGRPRN
jgi:hypothetical protein